MALRAARIGLWEWDVLSDRLVWSAELEALCGLAPGGFGGRTDDFLALVHPADRVQVEAAFRRQAESGGFNEIYRVSRPDGSVRWLEGKGALFRANDGSVLGGIGVAYDITRRREAELQSRAAQQQATEILESITDAFFAVDRDWKMSYVNTAGEQLLGLPREELLAMSVWDVPGALGEPFEPHYRQTMGGEAADFEAYWEHGGRWLDVRAYPTPTGISIYVRDVTARCQLEEQLRQSEKMRAIGQFAGGIAHDFNNSLQVIDGYASLLRGAVAGSAHEEHLAQLRAAASRAAGLARHLLAFGRQQELSTQIVDLNTFLDDASDRLQRLLGSRIRVTTALEAEAAAVDVDPTQIEQLVLNLGVNARDAMPNGGTFAISTSNITLEADWLNGKEAAGGPGPYVCARFSDSGCGIDAQMRDHLFEPFFTTKPEGSGLGLATVYAIVKKSGGYITVESKPGAGATFAVYLPVGP